MIAAPRIVVPRALEIGLMGLFFIVSIPIAKLIGIRRIFRVESFQRAKHASPAQFVADKNRFRIHLLKMSSLLCKIFYC